MKRLIYYVTKLPSFALGGLFGLIYAITVYPFVVTQENWYVHVGYWCVLVTVSFLIGWNHKTLKNWSRRK